VIKGRVSVVMPGCNERFMQATIDNLLANARGDVEIYAVIDGGPDQPIQADRAAASPRFGTRSPSACARR
jgi:hypothetical protein